MDLLRLDLSSSWRLFFANANLMDVFGWVLLWGIDVFWMRNEWWELYLEV
jgi:hypothetical protein